MRVAADAAIGGDERLPRAAHVSGFVRIRPHVARHVAVERGVGGRAIVTTGLNRRHDRSAAEPADVARDIRPGLAAVFGDLDVAVVGTHPNHLRAVRRLADGVDRRVHLGRRVVDRRAA